MPTEPSVLFDAATIAARVQALGAQIRGDYGSEPLHLVPVLTGSFVFAADLMRAIGGELTVDFLGVQSYGNDTTSSGVVQVTRDLSQPIADRHVLLVEDIVDTGLTMAYLLNNLRTRRPRSLRLAALLHKPARTRVAVPIDYLGFTVEDKFVVGYGLDHSDRHRQLPYIGVLPEPLPPATP